ncbi:hypothetical protein ACQPZJ_01610 [Actinoplanes sp. CA-054009]
MILIFAAAIAMCLVAGTAVGVATVLNRRTALAELGEHQGATTDSPPLVDEPGRHHEDTVEIVPAGWMPPIGRRRFASLTDTQRIDLEQPE